MLFRVKNKKIAFICMNSHLSNLIVSDGTLVCIYAQKGARNMKFTIPNKINDKIHACFFNQDMNK